MPHSFIAVHIPTDVERLKVRVADSSRDKEFIVEIGSSNVWISREHAEMLARDILAMIEQDAMNMTNKEDYADEYIPDPRD